MRTCGFLKSVTMAETTIIAGNFSLLFSLLVKPIEKEAPSKREKKRSLWLRQKNCSTPANFKPPSKK